MLPRQRVTQTRKITSVTSLTKDDLVQLQEPRRVNAVKKLKDSHHFLARLFAAGLDIPQVSARTGYTPERLRRQKGSPAFLELIAQYRAMVTENWIESIDDYQEILLGNMIRAELQIADKLGEAEDNNETLPTRELVAISRDAADRMGYGKKQTNVNVNVDFAAQLEKAIRRSASARVIDTTLAGPTLGERPALAGPLLAREPSPAPSVPTPPPRSMVEQTASPSIGSALPADPIPFRRRV